MTKHASLVKNAGDPDQVKEAARKVRTREDRYEDALKGLMSLPEGRLVLGTILERAGVYTQSFVDHNEGRTAFNEGRRAIGNQLLGEVINASEEHYLVMVRELKKLNG